MLASQPEHLTYVSTDRLAQVLEYVRPSERCVLDARLTQTAILARVKFRSPRYTRRPVSYLTSSVLAVSLAQVTHVLLDNLVRSPKFPYQGLLSAEDLGKARRNHEIYFLELSMRFAKRHPDSDYSVWVQMNRMLKLKEFLFATFTFSVRDYVTGAFKGSVPLPPWNHLDHL